MPSTEDRIDKIEREIRIKYSRFNSAIDALLRKFITEDGIDEFGLRSGFRDLAFAFATDLSNVYLLGGQITADEASQTLNKPLSFNSAELTTVAAINELRNRVIIGLQRQQEEAIQYIRNSASNIVPIRSVAEIRRNLRLTARQIEAVENYRRLLENGSKEALSRTLRDRRFDSTVNNSINSGTPLTSVQIDRMVERYQDRQLAYRARTIAATEAVRIANQSDRDFFQQIINNGQIQRERLTRTWINSKDSKVRDSHNDLGDTSVEFDEPWVTSNGNVLMFPGDPSAPAKEVINCRCWVRTDIQTA